MHDYQNFQPVSEPTFDELDHTDTLFDPANTRTEVSADDAYDAALERMVDTLNISYAEARERLSFEDTQNRISPSNLGVERENETLSEVTIAVELGSRALHLLDALSAYSRMSRIAGLSRALEYDPRVQNRYSVDQLDRIMGSMTPAERNGYRHFYQASGAEALKATGMDAQEVDSDVLRSSQKFMKTYIGSTNRSEREKYRRRLNKQLPHHAESA